MDNPKHLRLWDCAVCSDDVQEREIAPLPLDEIKTPNSLISGLPGFTQLPGASFDSSILEHTSSTMRTPGASGIATPASFETNIYSTNYHYQSHSTKDRGRYDRRVQLRLQKKSAYGDLDDLAPLSPEQLRTPAVLSTSIPVYEAPTPRSKSDTLYNDQPSSGPQKLLDAAHTLATEAIQAISPSKPIRDPLLRKTEPVSLRSAVKDLLPSYLTSLWSGGDDKPDDKAYERVQVTQSLQQNLATNSPSFGGAYAPSPYRIPRPSYVDATNFPSPSRTPYAAPSRRRE